MFGDLSALSVDELLEYALGILSRPTKELTDYDKTEINQVSAEFRRRDREVKLVGS